MEGLSLTTRPGNLQQARRRWTVARAFGAHRARLRRSERDRGDSRRSRQRGRHGLEDHSGTGGKSRRRFAQRRGGCLGRGAAGAGGRGTCRSRRADGAMSALGGHGSPPGTAKGPSCHRQRRCCYGGNGREAGAGAEPRRGSRPAPAVGSTGSWEPPTPSGRLGLRVPGQRKQGLPRSGNRLNSVGAGPSGAVCDWGRSWSPPDSVRHGVRRDRCAERNLWAHRH